MTGLTVGGAGLAIAGLLLCGAGLAAEPSSQDSLKRLDPRTDWPWWRGPQRNGLADPQQSPPREWSDAEGRRKNILWAVPVPGRGHGSATVVGEQVLLATAEKTPREVQAVMCWERATGKLLWRTIVHRGGQTTKGNKKSTQASSSVACDGERLFINFINADAVYTTALDRSGKQLWQTRISDYVVHQGYGSSPAVYGDLVLVSADNKGGGAVAGLDRRTGEVRWRHQRPEKPNYASPIVLHVAGRDQLLFSGCDVVASYDPVSGEKLWETAASTTECVTSIVTDGERVFVSGGYPKNHVAAILGDGSGKVVWENSTRVYVPSMLVRDGHLYAVADAGVATCWNCRTGEELWKQRLGGGFTASPAAVGDVLYAANESGAIFVFRATPQAMELLGENQLGDEIYASPVICDSRIYQRVVKRDGSQTEEWLYCIGAR